MSSNSDYKFHPDETSEITSCPKCGAKDLLKERLPGGEVEILCPSLNCDFTHVSLPSGARNVPPQENFARRVADMDQNRLRDALQNLDHSVQSLTGRQARSARRQLAIVSAKLHEHVEESHEQKEDKQTPHAASESNQKVPPQLQTRKAAAKRVQGIREYYRRKKEAAMKGDSPASFGEMMSAGTGHNRWLESLVKSLHDEAVRHEQAAQSYARVPDLFPLHIEHSARAFELNRIIDLISNYAQVMSG